jgi:hypothetical protein
MRVWIRLICRALALHVAMIATAQAQISLAPERYDPRIPTPESVIGHAPGAELTTPEDIVAWFRALEAAAPDRVDVVEYGRTHQGRPLIYATIAAPQWLARLAEVKAQTARLASGQVVAARDVDALAAATPAVAWMSYGVHGDEVSSPEAAVSLAYRLVAAEGDPLVDKILRNAVIIIDPLQNPDGRNRFVQSFEDARGIAPQADRFAAEHDQPWPGGRFNQALFDMNRDWFSLTQPETRGRVRAILEWNPVLLVDGHEMDGDQSYFFPPVAEPVNPNVTSAQMELEALIGRNNAAWFDRLGYDYFTREIFDAFYPGYGDMWPKLNGAVALTYEQGSPRGLIFRKSNGEVLTLKAALDRHLAASLATLETLADHKGTFLSRFAADRRSAVEAGRSARDRYFLIDLEVRRGQAEDLGQRLVFQGVETTRLPPGAQACGRRYPAGALAVDTARPNRPLILTLLGAQTPLSAAFMEGQEDRRRNGLDHELYDTTAWSLPLMDGASATTCDRIPEGGEPVRLSAIPSRILEGDDGYGFVVPWTDTLQARLVITALQAGLKARTVDSDFSVNGRSYGAGSVVFAAYQNPPEFRTTLKSLAQDIGAELHPLSSGWVDSGVNFGSDKAQDLSLPKIAIAWDRGPDATAAGAARHVIERVLGIPATPVRTHTIAQADLAQFDVVILPEGRSYARTLGEAGVAALSRYVEDGGVLVAFGQALAYLSESGTGITSMRRERAASPSGKDAASDSDDATEGMRDGVIIENESELQDLIRDPDARPDSLPGALANAERVGEHFLGSGYRSAVTTVSGQDIYHPLNRSAGSTVLRFAAAEQLLASGHMWEENRRQLAFKPFVTAEGRGDGLVIGFTQNAVERGYLNGLNLLVANAVLLAPAHSQ